MKFIISFTIASIDTLIDISLYPVGIPPTSKDVFNDMSLYIGTLSMFVFRVISLYVGVLSNVDLRVISL